MGDYRIYFQDAFGRFKGVEVVEADTDEAALNMARQFDHEHGFEVWSGKRKIGIVEATVSDDSGHERI